MRKSHIHDLLHEGPCFNCSTGYTGGTAGNAIDTQAPLCLYNPATSGVRAHLIEVSIVYISGVAATSSYWLCYNDTAGQAAPTGTSMIIKPSIMMGTDTPACQVFRDCTLPNAANVYLPFYYFDTAGSGIRMQSYKGNGVIRVDPGGILSIQGLGGPAPGPVVGIGIMWIETSKTGGGQ